MGRNAGSAGFVETSTESFAGLLGRLTGHTNVEADNEDLRSFSRSGEHSRELSDLVADSLSLSARAMRSELLESAKSGGSARSSRRPQPAVANELSYEKALQLHRRKIPPPLPPSSKPGLKQVAAAAKTGTKPAAIQASMAEPALNEKSGLRPDVHPDHRLKPHTARSAALDIDPAVTAGAADGRKRKSPKPMGAASRAGGSQGTDKAVESTNLTTANRRSKSKPHAKARVILDSPSQGPNGRSGASIRNGESTRNGESIQSVSRRRAQNRPRNGGSPPIIENGKLKPVGAREELELSLVSQRKSIVSIRLTDPEFAVLRDRADESGISVSAYMRSCVLEAETLRSQVKQAMAEMRSLSAVSGLQNYTATAPALTASGSDRNEGGGAGIRSILRSITVLLSPLLTFRRSA